MIKRYLIWEAQGEIFEDEHPDGEWVKYADVAAQLAAPAPSDVAVTDYGNKSAPSERQLVGHVPRFVLRQALKREAFYVSTAIHRDHNAPHDTVPIYVDGDFA